MKNLSVNKLCRRCCIEVRYIGICKGSKDKYREKKHCNLHQIGDSNILFKTVDFGVEKVDFK